MMTDPCAPTTAVDVYAQRQLTAAIVRNGSLLDDLGAVHEHFTDSKCNRIIAVATSEHAKGDPFDEFTLAPYLDETHRAALTDMIEELGDSSLVPTYAAMLRRQYELRKLNAIGSSLVAAAGAADADPQALGDATQTRVDELFDIGAKTRTCAAAEAVFRVEMKAIEAKRRGVPPGLKTGIDPLDEILQPSREGQLHIWAGATSMGKTSLATNFATNLSSLGVSVSYFTLEMSVEDLGARLLAGETGISISDILGGRLSEDELRRIQEATKVIASWPLRIEACPSLDAAQLMRRARQHRRKFATKLIVVDYLGLMRGKGRSFYEQVSDITRGLKIAAGELSLPVIALSQLNRDVERRSDGLKYEERYLRRRPKLSDLRDSGSIEQDADVVVFLHREEVYLARERPPLHDLDAYQEWNAAMGRHAGRADLVLAKQRQGKTGIATCSYDEVRFRFGRVAHA